MKTIKLLAIFMLLSTSAYTDWVGDMKDKLEKELEPVVGDIGAAISGGLYENASSLGFPGIEAKAEISICGISDDNDLITEDYIPIPWIAVRISLPKNIALFARGFSYAIGDSDENLKLLGGGIKYSVIKEKNVPPTPNVSLILAYNKLSTTDVSVNTISFGCAAGKKLPFISPYIGISYEMTTSEIKTSAKTLNPSKNSLRLGGGLEFKPLPFLFINGGVNYINSNLGLDIGLGLRFSI